MNFISLGPGAKFDIAGPLKNFNRFCKTTIPETKKNGALFIGGIAAIGLSLATIFNSDFKTIECPRQDKVLYGSGFGTSGTIAKHYQTKCTQPKQKP